MKFVKATLKDIEFMQKLVFPEVEQGIILERSDDEIAQNIRSYILAKEGEKLVGFGALHFHTPFLGEIRSLVVSNDFRGKGIGKKIVLNLLQEGRDYLAKEIFTLTYQKAFFESMGFNEISKDKLPAHKIWADCIKCKHFPVCDEIALIQTI